MKQLVSVVVILLLMTAATTVTSNEISSSIPISPATADEVLEPATSATTQTAKPSTRTTEPSAKTELPTEIAPGATTEAATETTEECTIEDEAIVESKEETYSSDDLDLLARVIYVEVGCEWIPDEVKANVGSVVLNRVASDLYPNTIREVLYDPGQYEPQRLYDNEPDECAYEIAQNLLETGSVLPADVLGQNGDETGDGVYSTYYDSKLGSTVYFTYVYG